MSWLGEHLEILYMQFFSGTMDEVQLLENLKGLKRAGIRDSVSGQGDGDVAPDVVPRKAESVDGPKFSWTKD